MKCKNIDLEYCSPDSNLPSTTITVNRLPRSVLNSIAKEYNKEIKSEGIYEFIEFHFGDARLTFRLQK